MTSSTPGVRLVPLPLAALSALADADLTGASEALGLPLTGFIVSYRWLWELRLEQIKSVPEDAGWIARMVVAKGDVTVGLAGFHAGPGSQGWVEVSYAIDPAHRRQGFGHAALATVLDWARNVPELRSVRASVAPHNRASIIILNKAGFLSIGEQFDPQDGRELLFELTLGGGA